MWVKTLILGETVKKLSSRAVAMLTNGVLALILIVVGCVVMLGGIVNIHIDILPGSDGLDG